MAAAEKPRLILSHLLAKLEEDGSGPYKRYAAWIQKHGREQLEQFLYGCLRPEVLTFLQLGSMNVTSLKNIGGDLTSDGRAIYIHGVLGLDRRTRIYIGQSASLRPRLKQHWNFRYRRDNPSLHYYAMQNSVFDIFSVLATLPSPFPSSSQTLPGMDQPDLLLNVLEAWCCLLFGCLPPQMLGEWLPPAVVEAGTERETQNVALNVANPLDHGEKGSTQWVNLSGSRDPLIRDYLKDVEARTAPIEDTKEPVVVQKGEAIPTAVTQQPTGIFLSSGTLVFLGGAVLVGFLLLRRGPGGTSR